MKNLKLKFLTDLLIVGIFFLIIFQLADFYKVFDVLPRGTHQWRQCDGYSMAINYYQEGTPLLEPKVHFQGSLDGKAVGEFPILYFMDAQLWKLIGKQSIFAARLFHFSFLFLAIFLLFRGISNYLQSRFVASLSILLLLISPVILFYSNTTTPTVPAFSLILISWYLLYQYYQKKQSVWIILAILCFTLAGLMRISMLMGLFAFSGAWFVLWLKKEKREKLVFRFYHIFLITIIPLSVAFLWVNFSKVYNLKADSGLFLTKTLPFWEAENVGEIWNSFLVNVFPESYSQWVMILVSLVLAIILIFSKTLNQFLVLFLVILILEMVVYFSLFFANFHVHDYYLVEFFLLIPVIVLLFTEWFRKRNFSKYYRSIIASIIIITLVHGMLYSATRTRMKYDNKIFGLTTVFLTEKEIGLWQWIHMIYKVEIEDFESVTPTLRKLGINRSNKVVVLSDQSPNISLSLMDQKGITETRDFEGMIDEKIDYWEKKGVKYAVVNYSSKAVDYLIQNGILKKIASYKHLNIYRFHFRITGE